MPSLKAVAAVAKGKAKAERAKIHMPTEASRTSASRYARESCVPELTPAERQEIEDRIAPVVEAKNTPTPGVLVADQDLDFRADIAARGRARYGGVAEKSEDYTPRYSLAIKHGGYDSDDNEWREPVEGEMSEYEELWHGPKKKRLYTMVEVLREGPRWMSQSEAADIIILKDRLAYKALGWARIREERAARMVEAEASAVLHGESRPNQDAEVHGSSGDLETLHENRTRPMSALSDRSLYVDSVETFSNAIAGIQIEPHDVSTDFFDGSKWYPK